jgi:metal-responsive CopG/Arc/MetJ family transcriptional regulator
MGEGPAKVIPVRLDDDLVRTLDKRADHDHVSRSEAIREAIRGYGLRGSHASALKHESGRRTNPLGPAQ